MTKTVKPYAVKIDGRVVTFVDTPGFDDTYRGDTEILAEVAEWLKVSYQAEQRLTGLIYIHDITTTRFTGTMLKNLRVFENLVGVDNFSNVILVTSKWDKLIDVKEGEIRESEIKQEFLGTID